MIDVWNGGVIQSPPNLFYVALVLSLCSEQKVCVPEKVSRDKLTKVAFFKGTSIGTFFILAKSSSESEVSITRLSHFFVEKEFDVILWGPKQNFSGVFDFYF
jgi:hypothetical protein